MRDIFPKFIIETDDELGDCLIISKCTFHKELVINSDKVKGGGWFEFDRENKVFTFYGDSYDFGEATLEDIIECVNNKNIYRNPALYSRFSDDHKFKYRTSDGEIIDLN